MTRINVVPVKELCDKHLLAEYRELPRVFKLARVCYDAPSAYTLGSGHVKFFYNKLKWLDVRFAQLVLEMRKRGFNPRYETVPYTGRETSALYKDWTVTPEALTINRARIEARKSEFKRKEKKNA